MRIAKYQKNIIFLSAKKAAKGDLVYNAESVKRGCYPFSVADENGTNGKKVLRIFNFGAKGDELIKIKNNDEVVNLSNIIDELQMRLQRESIILPKSELSAIINFLPDANLIGSGKLDFEKLKGLGNIYQFQKSDGAQKTITLEFKRVIMDEVKNIAKGVEVAVNGRKLVVNLKLGNFNLMGIEARTYYWSIWPSIISDEAAEMMEDAAKSFAKVMKETISQEV